MRNRREFGKVMKAEGLNSIQYKIHNVQERPLFTWIYGEPCMYTYLSYNCNAKYTLMLVKYNIHYFEGGGGHSILVFGDRAFWTLGDW